jgi:hypothetical protein
MDMSKLDAGDKRILIASVGVIIGGTIGLLAGIAAAGVVLQPQLAPSMKLPAPKATTLLVLGAVAAAGFALSALQYLSYALDVTRIYSILFDLGLVSAVVLLYFTWLDYKAAQSASAPAAPAATPPPPPPPPPAS